MPKRLIWLVVTLTFAVSACSGRKPVCPSDVMTTQFAKLKTANRACVMANDRSKKGDAYECLQGNYAVMLSSCLNGGFHVFADLNERVEELLDDGTSPDAVLQAHDAWLDEVRKKL